MSIDIQDQPVRVSVGEDDFLFRQGVVRVLTDGGLSVVAEAGNAVEFLAQTLAHRPDVAVVDIRMPPRRDDDGLQAAIELRERVPTMGVVLLTQHCEPEFAIELIGDRPEGVGYLLKERVGDIHDFVEAVMRVARGGSALDPEVVVRMLRPRSIPEPLAPLTPRERAVLAAMAEGLSNQGIAQALLISNAAVEKHVTAVFRKLSIPSDGADHRRVRAVLRYLTAQRA
ncbi:MULTISPECIES: response regulator transcription factor [unclassified Microbacterium]|uniref:response regulator transcription factor n=1 Tax=unclassified Microbacterium TaxID=2609290 RepID=UPI00214B009D|nr:MULTISPECIES: response regulator transcription factor [unclassified Microbacterium]MCR2810615.1 response regulator transcription factor [Microbacterium sp. zg.B185]WIM18152.1 response regulator transcription factor [Microbacterium sp. zg-B185]